jgi:hypothetical protein
MQVVNEVSHLKVNLVVHKRNLVIHSTVLLSSPFHVCSELYTLVCLHWFLTSSSVATVDLSLLLGKLKWALKEVSSLAGPLFL